MKSLRLYIVNHITSLLPETRCFGIKRILYRWAGAKIGDNVRICSTVTILGIGELSIGNDTWIGPQSLIIAAGDINIGNGVDIGPQVLIESGSHKITPQGIHVAGEGLIQPITIEDGVWLCARSTVLLGVVVGTHSILATGAVTISSVPSYTVFGGIPAKFIKKLQ